MLFEVYRNHRRRMCTDEPGCIPDAADIRSMKQAGYLIKDNRKKGKNQQEMEEYAQTTIH